VIPSRDSTFGKVSVADDPPASYDGLLLLVKRVGQRADIAKEFKLHTLCRASAITSPDMWDVRGRSNARTRERRDDAAVHERSNPRRREPGGPRTLVRASSDRTRL
jgi:hypothetical protein